MDFAIHQILQEKSAQMNEQAIIQALFEHATIGVLVVDASGEILMTNPFLENIFNYSRDELAGQAIDVLLPDSFRERHHQHRQSFFERPVSRPMGVGMALLGRRKDGSEFPVEISLGYTKVQDRKLVIAFVNDITKRKENERLLQEREQQIIEYSNELEQKVAERTHDLSVSEAKLEKALEKERELNELKSRFVSMASHEFRTPLTSILASSDLIKIYNQRGDLEKQKKHIDRIKSSVNNLTSILNDFLSLEKLESGRIPFIPVPVELDDFIHETLEEILLIASQGQTIHHSHQGKPTVNIDPHLVKNILLNLLSNALKYSPNGEDVELNTRHTKGCFIIEVKDQGIGIPKEEQEKMFNRFFRATNATNIQGTGLGLTIVKQYLDLMDGEISFVSEADEGATFTVEIPQ